jgi:hypothetical protein
MVRGIGSAGGKAFALLLRLALFWRTNLAPYATDHKHVLPVCNVWPSGFVTVKQEHIVNLLARCGDQKSSYRFAHLAQEEN